MCEIWRHAPLMGQNAVFQGVFHVIYDTNPGSGQDNKVFWVKKGNYGLLNEIELL